MGLTLLHFTVFLSLEIVLLLHNTEAAKSCVSCSTMENIVGPASMKRVLKTYNSPSCRERVNVHNITGIMMEFCESGDGIYETKTCGTLEGFVNGTAFDHPMNMKLFYRGCITINSFPLYGCQETESNQLDLLQNLDKVFQPLQHYVLNSFHGQRCLCQSNSCVMSSSQSRSFLSKLWIVATFLSFLSMSQ